MMWRATVIALLLATSGVPAEGVTLLLSSPDAALAKTKVQDNYKFIGLMGDYVDLPPGDHQLQIAAPRDYSLLIKLRVNEQGIELVEHLATPANCKPAYETTWQRPTLQSTASKKSASSVARTNQQAAPHWVLRVAVPTFGAAKNMVACSLPSMLSCNKSMMVVEFDSIPSGAEIWIDGDRVGVTKTVLSVPYCPSWEKTKDVVLRLPGRVVCQRELLIAESERTSLSCDLTDVK